jgi:mRNA interferase MazF
MKGGDVIITSLPQADGFVKNRPALALCPMRPFGDLLVCGISTQLQHEVADFDEVVAPGSLDFATTGLSAPSLIRLGFISTVPVTAIKGRIGAIDSARYLRLMDRLSRYLAGFTAQ